MMMNWADIQPWERGQWAAWMVLWEKYVSPVCLAQVGVVWVRTCADWSSFYIVAHLLSRVMVLSWSCSQSSTNLLRRIKSWVFLGVNRLWRPKPWQGKWDLFLYLLLAGHLFSWEKAPDLAISQKKSAFLSNWAPEEQGQGCVKLLIVVEYTPPWPYLPEHHPPSNTGICKHNHAFRHQVLQM